MKTLTITLLPAALLFLAACTSKQESPAAEAAAAGKGNTVTITAAQAATAKIRTGRAEERDLTSALRVQGMLHVPPQFHSSITAPFGGTIRSVSVLPGDHVHKGDVIGSIENVEFVTLQQNYLQTRNSLDVLEAEYKRQQTLAANNVNATKTFERATADVKNARVELASLREKLALIGIDAASLKESAISRTVSIRAPIPGYVSSMNINNGQHVAPNTVMIDIMDTEHMHIEMRVFEKDVMHVHAEQRLTATLNDDPSKSYAGHVHLVGKEVDADRTVTVHGHFDATDPSLIPGTSLTASITVDAHRGLCVPEASVVLYQGKHYIFAHTGGNTYRQLAVDIGSTTNGWTEVMCAEDLSALNIVTVGAHVLLGAMVNRSEE